jgi:hypothetical protein
MSHAELPTLTEGYQDLFENFFFLQYYSRGSVQGTKPLRFGRNGRPPVADFPGQSEEQASGMNLRQIIFPILFQSPKTSNGLAEPHFEFMQLLFPTHKCSFHGLATREKQSF